MSVTSAFANLSIRNKIVAGLLPLILLLGAVGTTSIQKFAQMNEKADSITTNYMLAIGYLADMRAAVLHYRLDITKAVLRRTTRDQAATVKKQLDGWLAKLDAGDAQYALTV